jgi:hypothetical protein
MAASDHSLIRQMPLCVPVRRYVWPLNGNYATSSLLTASVVSRRTRSHAKADSRSARSSSSLSTVRTLGVGPGRREQVRQIRSTLSLEQEKGPRMITALAYPATRYEAVAWPDLSQAPERARLTPAAVRGMRRLADEWGLTVDQVGALLGDVPASTWHAWVKTPPRDLGVDRLTRVSLLLGIYAALQVLYPGPLANQWVSRPNTNVAFAGRTPLDVMIAGGIGALERVRSLVDARRGG